MFIRSTGFPPKRGESNKVTVKNLVVGAKLPEIYIYIYE